MKQKVDGKTAGSLIIEETDPLVEFCLMDFLFSVHGNLLYASFEMSESRNLDENIWSHYPIFDS